MSKELPYLKFNVSEWISGAITLEEFEVQGVFINICAHYWFKSGCLTLTEIKRRVKCKQAIYEILIQNNLIKVTDDAVSISFLDEQLNERNAKREINKLNGSKGGAPVGNKNAIKDKQETTEKQPKTTNIEQEKEQEKEQDIISFDLFWNLYDKKRGKDKTFKLWQKVSDEDRAKIMIHLQAYTKTEQKFRKDPERYLSHKSWNDEIIGSSPTTISLNQKYKYQ